MSRQYVRIPDSGQEQMLTQQSVPVTVFASDINPVLEQRVERAGQPYLSPRHTLNYASGAYGVPYWMRGLMIQTCDVTTITAPKPDLASIITHPTLTLSQQGQYGLASTPTAGIYTGSPVEDHC
jgi:hypothetical protein